MIFSFCGPFYHVFISTALLVVILWPFDAIATEEARQPPMMGGGKREAMVINKGNAQI